MVTRPPALRISQFQAQHAFNVQAGVHAGEDGHFPIHTMTHGGAKAVLPLLFVTMEDILDKIDIFWSGGRWNWRNVAAAAGAASGGARAIGGWGGHGVWDGVSVCRFCLVGRGGRN